MDYAQLVQDVLDGEESGLKALCILKDLKKDVERYISAVEPTAKDEADKFSEKTFDHGDYTIEKRNGGKMFSFKGIEAWEDKKQDLKDIEERLKQSYYAYEKGLLTADENGEQVIVPAVSFRSDSLVIKKRKNV